MSHLWRMTSFALQCPVKVVSERELQRSATMNQIFAWHDSKPSSTVVCNDYNIPKAVHTEATMSAYAPNDAILYQPRTLEYRRWRTTNQSQSTLTISMSMYISCICITSTTFFWTSHWWTTTAWAANILQAAHCVDEESLGIVSL